jgi:RNA polymerase sigma factor (sigma-70 family)
VLAFTGLDMFRGDAAFGTWITRIAMNEALGRLRRRRPTVDWETYGANRQPAEIIHFSALTPGDPEQNMAQSEIRAVLERAIDALPDAFRAVFVARILEGMSVEETADQAMSVSRRTWQRRLFDDVVGCHEQGGRQSEAERFGRLDIDRQQNSRRLLDRKVSGLYPIENLLHVISRATVSVPPGNAVADQATGAGKICIGGNDRNASFEGQSRDTRTQVQSTCIGYHQQRLRALGGNRNECLVQFLRRVHGEVLNLDAEGFRLSPHPVQEHFV